ncbi:hypothetical protein JZ751_006941 [Albula glossodonta]|uniref:Calponin-homology (CH) domain-containing protein n=1 Tax=Albula glossodonta TaxID=121402 RepID=A0A8T2P488_9TELE|nr:hypothetical protein JZ751_006941 [Albula glossodonta]
MLTHLRQLDVSCNELQCLPVEIGQLESLRDLNLRRNQLTTLPEELSELPLVRLDVSCNRIARVPVCYRHLRHLQTIALDNNPLQSPPAQICSKGKFHIFKFLNIEACKTTQEELERALRPTEFNSCLSDQELYSGRQYGGLDSGFNSVDSGSKRWSGNESADDFSELSLRMAELSRDQRNLREEGEKDSPSARVVNGEAEQVDFIDSSVTEEEEEDCRNEPSLKAPSQDKKENITPSHSPDSSPNTRSSIGGEVADSVASPPPSSPTLEERRRPGNLQIWQERERAQQQRERGRDPIGGSSESIPSVNGLRQRCASADQMSTSSHPPPPQRSISRTDTPLSPKASSPPGLAQKPSSFLFRASSRCNVKTSEMGRSESRPSLRSPREERQDVLQLRKTLESRLKLSLPDDLGEALSNGTILCQLANHVRPRAVSIIHIPSPAVPKLSAAKCRLNVENFIAACRKLGVPEADVCLSSDVLSCNLPAVMRTVEALAGQGQEGEQTSPPHCSQLPHGFLLFYCLAMALLYMLYCHLTT